MIIKANTNFTGILDLSALERLQEVNNTETDFFRIGIRPGQIIEVDDKWYSLKNIQTAVAAGYIQIFGYKGEVKEFLNLNDAPSSYSGSASKAVVVKADESGLEFVANPWILGDGVAKITVGATEPVSPSVGDLWVDLS